MDNNKVEVTFANEKEYATINGVLYKRVNTELKPPYYFKPNSAPLSEIITSPCGNANA